MPDSAVKSQKLDASELRATEHLDARRIFGTWGWDLDGVDYRFIPIWVFPKIVGIPPKSSILIGFGTIIFTIHFGYPYFWKHPYIVSISYW